MESIRVLSHVQSCYNSDDGRVIFKLLHPILKRQEPVTLSFDGVQSVPSSFVNSALIALLKDIPFSDIRRLVKFTDTNSQINSMILSRFEFEVSKQKPPPPAAKGIHTHSMCAVGG